jgi:hypothetical protein
MPGLRISKRLYRIVKSSDEKNWRVVSPESDYQLTKRL